MDKKTFRMIVCLTFFMLLSVNSAYSLNAYSDFLLDSETATNNLRTSQTPAGDTISFDFAFLIEDGSADETSYLRGATLTVKNSNNVAIGSATTGEVMQPEGYKHFISGKIKLNNLSTGKYFIATEKEGFETKQDVMIIKKDKKGFKVEVEHAGYTEDFEAKNMWGSEYALSSTYYVRLDVPGETHEVFLSPSFDYGQAERYPIIAILCRIRNTDGTVKCKPDEVNDEVQKIGLKTYLEGLDGRKLESLIQYTYPKVVEKKILSEEGMVRWVAFYDVQNPLEVNVETDSIQAGFKIFSIEKDSEENKILKAGPKVYFKSVEIWKPELYNLAIGPKDTKMNINISGKTIEEIRYNLSNSANETIKMRVTTISDRTTDSSPQENLIGDRKVNSSLKDYDEITKNLKNYKLPAEGKLLKDVLEEKNLFGKTSWMLQQLCSKEKQDYCSVRKDTEMDQLKNWQDTYFVPVKFVKEDTKQPVVEKPSINIISYPAEVKLGEKFQIEWAFEDPAKTAGMTEFETSSLYCVYNNSDNYYYSTQIQPPAIYDKENKPTYVEEGSTQQYNREKFTSAMITAETLGKFNCRAYIKIGGKHYWTDEKTINVIEEIQEVIEKEKDCTSSILNEISCLNTVINNDLFVKQTGSAKEKSVIKKKGETIKLRDGTGTLIRDMEQKREIKNGIYSTDIFFDNEGSVAYLLIAPTGSYSAELVRGKALGAESFVNAETVMTKKAPTVVFNGGLFESNGDPTSRMVINGEKINFENPTKGIADGEEWSGWVYINEQGEIYIKHINNVEFDGTFNAKISGIQTILRTYNGKRLDYITEKQWTDAGNTVVPRDYTFICKKTDGTIIVASAKHTTVEKIDSLLRNTYGCYHVAQLDGGPFSRAIEKHEDGTQIKSDFFIDNSQQKSENFFILKSTGSGGVGFKGENCVSEEKTKTLLANSPAYKAVGDELVQAFVKGSQTYGVDSALVLSIYNNESNFHTNPEASSSLAAKNPGNIHYSGTTANEKYCPSKEYIESGSGEKLCKFASFTEGVDNMYELLSDYHDSGTNTVEKAMAKWSEAEDTQMTIDFMEKISDECYPA